MTVQEKRQFTQSFNRLAVALRLPSEDADAVMQRIYWEALKDLPIEAVDDAARELARDAEWFPKTSEWRAVAERARNARDLARALPAPRANPWQVECETCDDTGWESRACPGHTQCGRTTEHAAHGYVLPCGCRPTNRTYQRKKAEEREWARRRDTKARRRSDD